MAWSPPARPPWTGGQRRSATAARRTSPSWSRTRPWPRPQPTRPRPRALARHPGTRGRPERPRAAPMRDRARRPGRRGAGAAGRPRARSARGQRGAAPPPRGRPRRPGAAPAPLAGAPPGQTGHGTMLTARQVLALCCGAEIGAIRWRDGLPLDVGRTARTEPPGLRRALEARDRGCRWTQCGALAAWATAHHIRPWSKGGATSLNDLALFCHLHHHYFIHILGWTVTGDPNGTLHFTTPVAGSPSRAPSPATEPRDRASTLASPREARAACRPERCGTALHGVQPPESGTSPGPACCAVARPDARGRAVRRRGRGLWTRSPGLASPRCAAVPPPARWPRHQAAPAARPRRTDRGSRRTRGPGRPVRRTVRRHPIADDPALSGGQQIGGVRRQPQMTGGPPKLSKHPLDRGRIWVPAAQEDQAVRPDHGCGRTPHPAIPLEQSGQCALFQRRAHGVLVEVEVEPADHELTQRWPGRLHGQLAFPACDPDDQRLIGHQERGGDHAFGRPDFLAGHADFLIQHPQYPGPVKPARTVNRQLVHQDTRPAYWPSSQRPGAMSPRASAGPHDPGAYGTTAGGLVSSGPATSHTAASPSGRVNRERSPSSTSWISRT